MVTNYPQDMFAAPLAADRIEPARGLFTRALNRLQHAVCALRGHDSLLHFDQNRMFLRCASCGHETPGWDIDETRPRLRFHGDPRRHVAAAGPRLVGERKIA
jgi:hypothetical protein